MKHNPKRSRLACAIMATATMILGLLSRSSALQLPPFVSAYAGDTLWALLVFWMFALLLSRQSTTTLVLFSFLFAFGIEFSQFYQAPWINSIRNTRLGGLVLGYGFKSSDLICYAVGIGMGAGLDQLFPMQMNQKAGYPKKSEM